MDKKIIGIIIIVLGGLGLIPAFIMASSLYETISLIDPNPLRTTFGYLVGIFVVPIALIVGGIWLTFLRKSKK